MYNSAYLDFHFDYCLLLFQFSWFIKNELDIWIWVPLHATQKLNKNKIKYIF